MTATHPPASPPPRRARPFVKPGTVNLVATVVMLIGLAAAIGGVAYDINAMTQTHADVRVQVQARSLPGLRITSNIGGDNREFALPRRQAGETPGTMRMEITGARTGWLEAPTDRLTLRAWDSTMLEQAASRGAPAVIGLCLGLGCLLLQRLLGSIADG